MTLTRNLLLDRFGSKRAIVDDDALLAYECDGFTILKQKPLAVVLPETTEEVQWIIRALAKTSTPFLPRGAGTCLSGGPTPIGPAVIIETSRMRAVLDVNTEDLLAVVQPGLVNAHLTRHVHDCGLHYAPDPSSQTVCTLGGNIAENSGGPHCFKYGMTTDHLLGAVVVLPDGEIAHFGDTLGPRASHELDLLGLFTGSEGTFGIATELTVRLCPDPETVRTMLASFKSMDDACAAVSDIVARGMVPSALEILDQATIQAVEASVYRAGYPLDAAAVLLVELDGSTVAVDDDAENIINLFTTHGALRVEEASSPEERARLWKGRKGAFGAMGRLNTDLYVLDGVVPRPRLPDALRRFAAIGEKYGVTLTNVFHAGDGNLHPNISFDGRNPDEVRKVMAAGTEILQTCMDFGGSITGEHGIGSEKLEHVSMMYDENDLEVMHRIRLAFDPSGLCNPGKVLPERSSCAEVARRPDLMARILEAEENGS